MTVISKIGDNYYWASRKNVPMVKVGDGAFTIYVAITGAGYVKVIKPEKFYKDAASLLSGTAEKYDYIENMSIDLRTVTYWGKRVQQNR